MSRKFSVWFLGFLFIHLAGNFAVVSDRRYGQGEPKSHSESTLRKVRWISRFQGYRISDFQYGFELDNVNDEKIFLTRHLLSTTNNGSKNGSNSFSPTVCLSRGEKIAFTLGYTFILLVGLSGNLLILVVIATSKEFHNNLNSLLCNLVIADVLRMLTGISFELFVINKIGNAVSNIPADPGASGSIFCKSMFGLPPIFTFAFVFTLIFMTCERFVAIVFPFQVVIFKNKSKWIILSVWLASIVLEIPGLYAFDSMLIPGGDDYICGIDFSPHCDGSIIEDTAKCNLKTFKKYLSAVVYITFVIAFLCIVTLHTIMMIVLYKHRARFDPGSSRVSRSPTNYTRDVVRMLGVVSVVYVVTSLPSQIYQFGYLYDTTWLTKAMPVYFNFLLIFIGNLHSMIYPWIYPLFVKRFREKYATLFRKYVLHDKTRSLSDASTKSGRATTVTHDSLTNRLIHNSSKETQF